MLPDPIPGRVLHYAYLWADEARAGHEDGQKHRPAAIIVANQVSEDTTVLTVVPITHTQPADDTPALEIPDDVKKHLTLDDAPSWVILSEINDFVWPGPDLAKIPGTENYDYGMLTRGFFDKIKTELLAIAQAQNLARVKRTD